MLCHKNLIKLKLTVIVIKHKNNVIKYLVEG